MIDNFLQIRSILDFSAGNFIRVQTSRRFKDQPASEERLTQVSDSYFGSQEALTVEYPRLKANADAINARLYITPNPIALSEPYKAELLMFGKLYGDKALYGTSPESRHYLLYDADRGCELQAERIWNTALERRLQVMRYPTVTGEGFILRECDYATVFGQRNGFHPQCWALLYYGR